MSKENELEVAIFAGGCFWCIESSFSQLDGVEQVTSGYTGGQTVDPSYESIGTGETGHYEAIEILYDSKQIKYSDLLEMFFREIDPTDGGGQFADRGSQYRPAIFYTSDKQKDLAHQAIEQLNNKRAFDRDVIVPVKPAQRFYEAEEYHQKYSKKKPEHYCRYRVGSGRQAFVDATNEKHKERLLVLND